MYRAWAGHDPSIQPYLEYYGLTGGAAARQLAPAPVPRHRRRDGSGSRANGEVTP